MRENVPPKHPRQEGHLDLLGANEHETQHNYVFVYTPYVPERDNN